MIDIGIRPGGLSYAKFAIEQKERCLTTREIIDALKEIDPAIKGNPINSMSGTLSGKVSKAIMFNRYQPYEGAAFYYGLIEWCGSLDELDDDPIEELNEKGAKVAPMLVLTRWMACQCIQAERLSRHASLACNRNTTPHLFDAITCARRHSPLH